MPRTLLNRIDHYFFSTPYAFASRILQIAFGIYFLLVGVKKFRVDGVFQPVEGLPAFASSIVNGAMKTEIFAREAPTFLLWAYGYTLPFLELTAGILLLAHYKIKYGFLLVGFLFWSFIFGQMYSGNTSKIGTDYLPSLVALCIAVYAYTMHQRSSEAAANH